MGRSFLKMLLKACAVAGAWAGEARPERPQGRGRGIRLAGRSLGAEGLVGGGPAGMQAPAEGLVDARPAAAGLVDVRAAGRSLVDVRLAGGRVTETGRLQPLPGETVVDLAGAFLVPGLVDAHVHLTLGGDRDARMNAWATLDRGVTAVRDLGGPLERGEAPRLPLCDPEGPLVVPAGAALTRRGGYGAFLGIAVPPGAALAPLVEDLAGKGARVIKVVLTGAVDFVRGTAGPAHFDRREVEEVVRAARSLDLPVAAHANGAAAVALAVECGVDSVEHGILAGEEALRLMAERGTRWVPTLTPLFAAAGDPRWAGLDDIFARHLDAVGRAGVLGVRIVAGTDAGSPGVPHGSLGLELALLRRAGLSPEQLRAAVTTEAASLLGLKDGYGVLAPGSATDLVWFAHDPFRGDTLVRGESDGAAIPGDGGPTSGGRGPTPGRAGSTRGGDRPGNAARRAGPAGSTRGGGRPDALGAPLGYVRAGRLGAPPGPPWAPPLPET